jgi:hypothetical protein
MSKIFCKQLKIRYACGDDGINHQILKSTSEFICIHLTIDMHIAENATKNYIYAYVQHVSSLFLYNVTMILICNVKDRFGSDITEQNVKDIL